MSSKGKQKAKAKRLVITGVVVGTLLVAGALGVALSWWQQTQKNDSSQGSTNPDGTSNEPIIEGPRLPEEVEKAQDLGSQGKYDEANKELSSAIQAADSNDKKYDLYVQQGITYQNQGKNQEAIDAYKKADAIKQTSVTQKQLGTIAESLGDKAGAIAYYRRTIELLNTQSPMYQADKARLEAKIGELGG